MSVLPPSPNWPEPAIFQLTGTAGSAYITRIAVPFISQRSFWPVTALRQTMSA
jgi:hypothetical protein